MRTYDDLCEVMRECGIPFARISWEPLDPEDIPPLPHALLVPQRTRNAMADGGVCCKVTPYDIELYAHGSSIELEQRVDAALEAHDFQFNRYTVPLGDGIVETVWPGLDCIGI